jgi:hypothetical protein
MEKNDRETETKILKKSLMRVCKSGSLSDEKYE